ncbi:MAG: HAMP domain-containing protein [Treponema sp.]|nr:HAMP domain-containing protein [Treponema sp.]
MKIKFPISLKQILLFSTLIILVLGVSTSLVSTLIRTDDRIKAEENNLTINERTASTIEAEFANLQKNSFVLIEACSAIKNKVLNKELYDSYFKANYQVIFLSSPDTGLIVNPEVNIPLEKFEKIIEKLPASSKTASFYNSTEDFEKESLIISYEYGPSNAVKTAHLAFYVDNLIQLMSTGSLNSTILIQKDGRVLINPDYESKMMIYESVLPLVNEIMSNPEESNAQIVIDRLFTAVHQIQNDLFVITSISEKSVYAVINRTTYRIILFSLAVLFFAIILIRIFSNSLTNPIKDLVAASNKIEQGEFELDIKPRSHDEIGLLTSSFIQMGKGLSEREKLMISFSKFTNKTIAQKAASGQLSLGGENRNATIFFSDIRSFTAMSENMKPEEVVEFLNSYMTKMVECVNKTHGVVDKYIGDAIMAVWGAPESAGSAEEDALNAVTSALMMRVSLYRYNLERQKNGLAPVRIGCGINSGPVVAGQIGSNERMEYTVIGDAVNLASRTEALNKPFATDILITENTYNLIKDKVIVEEMPGVHVKGKTDAIKMYAVINLIGRNNPGNLDEVRKIIGTKAPDLTKVNTDDEEKKYQIQA